MGEGRVFVFVVLFFTTLFIAPHHIPILVELPFGSLLLTTISGYHE